MKLQLQNNRKWTKTKTKKQNHWINKFYAKKKFIRKKIRKVRKLLSFYVLRNNDSEIVNVEKQVGAHICEPPTQKVFIIQSPSSGYFSGRKSSTVLNIQELLSRWSRKCATKLQFHKKMRTNFCGHMMFGWEQWVRERKNCLRFKSRTNSLERKSQLSTVLPLFVSFGSVSVIQARNTRDGKRSIECQTIGGLKLNHLVRRCLLSIVNLQVTKQKKSGSARRKIESFFDSRAQRFQSFFHICTMHEISERETPCH